MIDRKILDDKAKYPDTLEVQWGDAKVSLGDLRAYDAEQQQSVEQYRSSSQRLETEYGNLANQYNQLRAAFEDLNARVAQPPATDPNQLVDLLVNRLRGEKVPTVLDQPGEFFQPVIERLKVIDQIVADNQKFKEDLRKELTGAFSFQVTKDMKRDYRHFKWPKDWTFEKVMSLANEQKILEPGSNYPDFDRIHETVMAPLNQQEERERIMKEAEDKGYERARTELAQTYVPGPGFGGGTSAGVSMKGKFGGIDKIPDTEILNDPDVWNQTVQ